MENDELTRRDFVTTVAAGIVAAAGAELGAQQQVTETNVEIKTPDGTCDAAFITPATGAHPAVIIWPGCIRAAAFNAEHGEAACRRRLLSVGSESVLSSGQVANLGRRVEGELRERTAEAQTADELDSGRRHRRKDAPALIAWLDMQKQVDRNKKIGTQGYCMGGGLVVRTAAAVPNRVGAGAHSTAADSSRRTRTARICSHRRSRRGCISASPPTTTCNSPTPRRS